MKRIKEDNLLNVTELQPFRSYKTIYSDLLHFKKIDDKLFMSEDNKRYRVSIIDFFRADKVFIGCDDEIIKR